MADALRYRPPVTLAELDEIEQESQLRHEVVDGIAYAMVGASADHGAIVNGVVAALMRRLSLPCQVFSESTRLRRKTDLADDYLYPDVMVACDPNDRASAHREKPVVIVEVLSPSTAATDRKRKFQIYRSIPELQHYLLIEQTHLAVEQFDRADGWAVKKLGAEDSITLTALSITIPLREFYAQVDFQE